LIEVQKCKRLADDVGDGSTRGAGSPGEYDSDDTDEDSDSSMGGGAGPIDRILTSFEDLLVMTNPFMASIISNNMQDNHFARMDARNSNAAAVWNTLTGNQNPDGSPYYPWTAE